MKPTTHQRPAIARNASECIGDTPLIEINDALIPKGKTLFAKMESANPNFSIKDRTAQGLVMAALQDGRLSKGGLVIESTSGNVGKSLAMLGAIHGFHVIVVVDPKVSKSVLNWYRAFGAKVDLIERPTRDGGYQKARISRVKELLARHPDAYWPNQYENLENRDYHSTETGPEIFADIAATGASTLVGCVSTGGHLGGIANYLRKQKSTIEIVATDIAGSSIFGGKFSPYLVNGVGLSWRTANADITYFDKILKGSDAQAISMCRRISKSHGFLLGGSSGLVVFAALCALRHSKSDTALAILPDSGVNYLDQIYDDAWLEKNQVQLATSDELDKAINATFPIKPA